jgi:O-antigen/teichoic acid export membrane protein
MTYAVALHELSIGLNLFCYVISYGLYQYYWSVYYGLGKVAAYAGSEIIADLMIVSLAPLAILDHSLLIVPFYAGYLVFIIRAERSIRRALATGVGAYSPVLGTAEPDSEDRELWRYALVTVLGTAASMATLQLGVVVAQQAVGAVSAGAYAAAYSLILPLMYLPRTLATALLPRAAEEVAHGRHDAIRTQLVLLTDFLALVALPLCVIGIAVARPIIEIVYGSQYSRGVAPLRLLLVAAFFLMVSVPAVNMLSAGTVRNLAVPFYASVAGFLVGVATWGLLLTRGGGLVAVSVGVLAGTIIKAVPPVVVAYKKYRAPLFRVGALTLVLIVGGALGTQGGVLQPAATATAATVCVASIGLLVSLLSRKRATT